MFIIILTFLFLLFPSFVKVVQVADRQDYGSGDICQMRSNAFEVPGDEGKAYCLINRKVMPEAVVLWNVLFPEIIIKMLIQQGPVHI